MRDRNQVKTEHIGASYFLQSREFARGCRRRARWTPCAFRRLRLGSRRHACDGPTVGVRKGSAIRNNCAPIDAFAYQWQAQPRRVAAVGGGHQSRRHHAVRSGGTNRTLAVIKDELDVALKRETTNIIAIGGLLAEARRHLRDGEWYPWLEQNFSLSRQSADRYIGIYRLSLKTPNLGDLKIRRSVLYAMFLLPPKRRLSPKAIETIMEEARTKWVGLTRAYQIEREIKLAEEAAYRREIEAIESGEKPEHKVQDAIPPWESLPEPLPELPPTPAQSPAAPREQSLILTFQQAVKALATKPAAKFIDACIPNDLHIVADFLKAVATASKKADRSDKIDVRKDGVI